MTGLLNRILSPVRDQPRPLTLVELSFFSKQMAAFVRSGVNLAEALGFVADQASPFLKQVVLSLRRRVQMGAPLSRAMAAEDVFPPYYVGLVEAGERSGTLDTVFQRLGDHLSRERRYLGRVRSAMAYPLVVLVLSIVVSYLLLTFLVPKFAALALDLEVELPFITRMLFSVASFLGHPLFPLSVLLLVGGGVFYLARQGKLRPLLATLLQRVPAVQRIYLYSDLYRWTGMMALMKGAGLRLVDALALSSSMVSMNSLRDAIAVARQRVALGLPLYKALEGGMPPLVVALVRTGEGTGEVDRLLMDASRYYEELLEEALETASAFVQPLVLVFVGGVVFFILVAVFLPYGSILQAVQGLR